MDVLILPGALPRVVDEDELPADLPHEVQASIAAGKAALLEHAPAVVTEIEAASRALLSRASFAFPERA